MALDKQHKAKTPNFSWPYWIYTDTSLNIDVDAANEQIKVSHITHQPFSGVSETRAIFEGQQSR